MDLATLVTRCQAGDELAWESLVRRFQARIHGLAFHYVGNAEDARDLAQDIFIKLYEHLPACHPVERFVPWMLRIARNACIDRLRRRKARPPAQDVPVETLGSLAVPGTGAEQQWTQRERERLIHRALQSLSEINREMIILKEMQGMQLEEIAGMLELPLGTIKSRSSRARVELAKQVMALVEADGQGVGDGSRSDMARRDD
ncbi:MAG: sigma-70 family RNA polymerase sigma factor [Candidatus Eiseniibacteriota bacterium]|jgi:RNA polymerase sigma-70 factor (ECF subfamily)